MLVAADEGRPAVVHIGVAVPLVRVDGDAVAAHGDPCDMTTTPDGCRTIAQERVAEILGRYGRESIVGRFIRRASPEIAAAVERVEAALAAQPR